MDFLSEEIENYAFNHTEEESDILKLIHRETNLKTLMPRMLSGNLQGKFLGFLASISKANNILEIGSFTGYSAIAMAESTSEDCKIHCVEINEELAILLKDHIIKSGFQDRINILVGDAIDIIPKINFQPDFVFLDADKINYLNYYKLLIDIIPSGGIIIADNVLWSGKVLTEPERKDLDTKALIEFNEFIQSDNRVTNILLPIRDGLMLIRKK